MSNARRAVRFTVRYSVMAVLALVAGSWAAGAQAAEDVSGLFLQGQISVAGGEQVGPGPDDRLIIKTYHPGADGVEKDPKYTFRTAADLPIEFRVSPPIDMNGNARWPTFRVEAFTDNDGDVLTLGPGELFATTGDPVPLGTEGIDLVLMPVE